MNKTYTAGVRAECHISEQLHPADADMHLSGMFSDILNILHAEANQVFGACSGDFCLLNNHRAHCCAYMV